MLRPSLLLLLPLSIALALPGCASPPSRSLFNGRNLDGWSVVNGAPSTWIARDGILVCSGVPTGVLRSDRQYENFVLELEYRHMVEGGNAGLFLWSDPLPARGQPFTRSLEVQVMDGRETPNYTSHGDVFAIHGATFEPDRPHPAGWMRSLPSEKRAKPAGEWNHYRVVCRDGALDLEVNGKRVSGGTDATPRKGYICLEAEGSEVHFRNLRVTELPPSEPPPPPKDVADLDRGFTTLYNGVDFSGWDHREEHAGSWQARDWVLDYDGRSTDLWTRESFRDFELIVDWRFSGPASDTPRPVILPDGSVALDDDGNQRTEVVADAGDSGIYLRGGVQSQVNIWCWPVGSGEVYGYRTDPSQPAEVRAGVTPRVQADAPLGQWNRFHITLVGERLTVVLNDEPVITNAELPGLAAEGPIGLQNHGSPIQFANLFMRRLN